ncbi:glycosyltransferase [Vibrio sp. SCSIO 43136]|uniref:glycosyltransferase n=1 Tax=Vibrio sp. SCSIO 43136 TaxID=2819101 RepID=UPI0020754EFA|nr:glycosyltransferase [Vibrio sp. SCSIO 43136]USD67036.1 hypothetical protein J4N39_20585 [Vibrio sp. SCSIO 43136]
MKKIFVTVGAQLPFDRLIHFLDNNEYLKKFEVFAQIGNGNYKPKNINYVDFLDDKKYKELVNNSDILISHAGMGTIISSMDYNKPLIVLPRLSKFNEHRNDHQIDTVKLFGNRDNKNDLLRVCSDTVDIIEAVRKIANEPLKMSALYSPKSDGLVKYMVSRVAS